jgi:CBS domain-containing protein
MNILFFLTPKNEVAYIRDNLSVGKTLEYLEQYRYTVVPIINQDGCYVGTLTEGDILYGITNRLTQGESMTSISKMLITKMKRKRNYKAIKIGAKVEDLFTIATNQNFVPVVDDDNTFIGIVTRRDIMKYHTEQITMAVPDSNRVAISAQTNTYNA